MIDILLVVVIIALLGYMAWDRYENRKERSKLINAIVAKTPEQMRDLEALEKIEVKANVPLETPPDLVPTDGMSDKEFDEQIRSVIEKDSN